MKLKKLCNQVIVITGATSGIGLVTARMAAAHGARVVLVARTEDSLQRLCNEIKAAGGEAEYVSADVANSEQVARVADVAVEAFGGFDTWVNNAGVSIYGNFEDVPIEDQRSLFETNYWGLVYGSLVAVKHLKQSGGALINVGSALSDRAVPIQGTYCASKHAVKAFTDALRMELEHDGAPISVTLIKPASIDTPYRQHAKNYMRSEPKNPAPVYAPEPVAEAILYAAEHAVRDLFVGGAAKALAMAGYFAPRLTDKVMERNMFKAQQMDYPSASPHTGLDRPSGSLLERGDYPGHVASTSLYTKAVTNPLMTWVLLGAGLSLGVATAWMLRTNGHRNAKPNRDTVNTPESTMELTEHDVIPAA